jgi:hypothetical protein
MRADDRVSACAQGARASSGCRPAIRLTTTSRASAPGAHRGSGRLAAARSRTATIAPKRTMASVICGVIELFITHFLVMDCGRRRLALPSRPVCPALTTLWTATAGGVRLIDEPFTGPVRPVVYGPCLRGPGRSRQGQRRSPIESPWPETSRPAGHGPAPWPGPHLGLAGQPACPPSRRAHAGSSACRCGCASSPGQPPSRQAGHGRPRLSSQALPRRRRR